MGNASHYEMCMGLEVHVELQTKSKIFCSCPTPFGAKPNTQCCPVCMGMPGTLPVLNEKAVDFAIKAGLATHCSISRFSKFDRKHYVYPDLPKAYQITQSDLPLCRNGYLEIETQAGTKRVGITRIHLEEDAGKLIHVKGQGTLLDCNRCGVPLIEIVSEPDLRSAEEAKAYLQKLRAVILYTGVSDCKMNEGSFRCDINLSVRKKGGAKLGTRTEMKNLNSFQFAAKAIVYEFQRQVEELEAGRAVCQETRRFDPASGKTLSMRRKENAKDYRFFPEPDLPPIEISSERLEQLRAEIPALPDERKQEYQTRYGLSAYAAEQITSRRELADFFEQAARWTEFPKLAASFLMTDVPVLLPPDETTIPITPEHLAKLCQMLGTGQINSSTGRQVFQALWKDDQAPEDFVKKHQLEQISDEKALTELARQVLRDQPKMALDYQNGRTAALKALVGQMMKKTRGRCDPIRAQEILKALLDGGAGGL